MQFPIDLNLYVEDLGYAGGRKLALAFRQALARLPRDAGHAILSYWGRGSYYREPYIALAEGPDNLHGQVMDAGRTIMFNAATVSSVSVPAHVLVALCAHEISHCWAWAAGVAATDNELKTDARMREWGFEAFEVFSLEGLKGEQPDDVYRREFQPGGRYAGVATVAAAAPIAARAADSVPVQRAREMLAATLRESAALFKKRDDQLTPREIETLRKLDARAEGFLQELKDLQAA